MPDQKAANEEEAKEGEEEKEEKMVEGKKKQYYLKVMDTKKTPEAMSAYVVAGSHRLQLVNEMIDLEKSV